MFSLGSIADGFSCGVHSHLCVWYSFPKTIQIFLGPAWIYLPSLEETLLYVKSFVPVGLMNSEFHFLHFQGRFQLHRCLRVVDPTISIVVSPSFPGGVGITCWLVVCNKVVAIMLHPFSWKNPSNPWSPQLHLHHHGFKLIKKKKEGSFLSWDKVWDNPCSSTWISVSIPFDFSSQSLSFSFERTALLAIEPHFGFIHGRATRFCHCLLSPTSKSVGFVVLNWKCAGIRN